MRWLRRNVWKAGIAIVGMLLLLVFMVWVPVSAASLHEMRSGLVTPVTGTVQATPTMDPTMTALQKEQLALQNDKLKSDNSWAWLSPVSAIFGPLATIGTILVGILVARNNFLQWSKNRDDEQKKRAEDQRIEREKRDEERFQKVVEGLGSERKEAKVGAAITLRTFLQPGYERFYRQAFDLAVAHLRLRKADATIPLDSLSQALISVFRESFPRARQEELKKTNAQFDPQQLDATDVQLDHAYLVGADLVQAWLVQASLREANLSNAQLEGANLSNAQLEGAVLVGAQLKGAVLVEAQLEGANLRLAQFEGADLYWAQLKGAKLNSTQLKRAELVEAQFEGADLSRAQLERADLSRAQLVGAQLYWAQLEGANPEDADSLKDAKMNGVIGLTPEQRKRCIKKGAIFDDVQQAPASATGSSSSPPPYASNDTQALSAPPAQESTPTPDTGGSSTASSQ